MQGASPAPYVLCDPAKWHVEGGLFGAEHEPRVIFWPCGQLYGSLLAVPATIDQHFYRCKYDVARTLAAFSATLHHEVDLRQLSEHVVAVFQETMQTAHVSLWLRKPTRANNQPFSADRHPF